ncbi:MAG: LysR family transcriptional regulator [Candidatus Bathyarchaeia archaeon]
MPSRGKTRTAAKFWLEYEGKPILGSGGVKILEAIKEEKSISKAAKKLGMSYRYVWNYLARMKNTMGEPIVETFKGGRAGGGGARLTQLGEHLIKEYSLIESHLGEILDDKEYLEAISLRISARNRLRGKVLAVEKDIVAAKVKIEITVPAVVTALISREAVEELDIKVGDAVEAVIKATEVMIAK